MASDMVRASPLPAAERRAAIMAATERLLVERGKGVSTREIAEAAGIAEGTIFRVFPTKEAIIDAIFEQVLDPRPGWERMKAIDPALGLEGSMVELVSQMQRAVRRLMDLVAAVGFRQPRTVPRFDEFRGQAFEAIASVIRPYADQLRVDPDEAARLLHGMVLSMTNPMMNDRPIHDPAKIADVVLRGVGAEPERRP
jgi:AcrR family transcriptional regulator